MYYCSNFPLAFSFSSLATLFEKETKLPTHSKNSIDDLKSNLDTFDILSTMDSTAKNTVSGAFNVCFKAVICDP